MEQRIKQIIKEILSDRSVSIDTSTIKDGTKFQDIGLTSFDLAVLTVKLEDEFRVDIFENGIISSFGEIVNVIKAKK
jgi:acyl carrier protein